MIGILGRWLPLDTLFAPGTADGLSHHGLFTVHEMEYLEALPDDLLERTIMAWIDAFPAFEERWWLASWHPYPTSIRSVQWMQALTERPHAFTEAASLRILNSIAQQVRHVASNLELDIRGNHLVKNLTCLLWAAAFFDGPETDTWRATGINLLAEALSEQVLDDGMHFERSTAYHAQVLGDLLTCHAALGDHPFTPRLIDTIRDMTGALADLTHPDGYVSVMNDGGMTMTHSPADLIEAATRVDVTAPAPQASFALPAAGYFGLRAGEDLLVVDCGPIGPDPLPAHAHGDVLSFEWSVRGKRCIVDPGVYEYAAGEMRDYSRSTTAHNTVTVDGQDQAEFWGSFRCGRRLTPIVDAWTGDADGMVLEGHHDGYAHLAGSPVHHRRFEATAGCLVITDRVVGGMGQVATASLLFHPDASVSVDGNRAEATIGDITMVIVSDAPTSLEDAWYSTDMGTRTATNRLRFAYGPAPTQGRIEITVR